MSEGCDPSKMACEGAPTVTVRSASGEMQRCQACGTAIASDLVDHPFWGFKAGCDEGER